MTNKIMVLHAVAGLHPSSGGPSRTVTGLVDALSVQDNMEVELYTQGHKGEPWIFPASANVETIRAITNNRISLGLGLPIKKALRNIPKHKIPMIVHGHGVWHPVNHWTASFARNNNIPLILHPRGMLEAWSLHQKKIKKKLALLAYQKYDLNICSLFVATADHEYESIRQMGLNSPVAIIPNGIQFQDCEIISKESKPINSSNSKRALFLSRIHPKKGLLNLLEAWKKAGLNDWILEIAGPDEAGHLEEVKSRISQLEISESVKYIGELDGNQKTAAYSVTDLFILPTFSENFGMVIAEALSFGVPVITTKGTPWADLEKYDCGWWIDIGVEPLVAALKQAASLTDVQRSQMGSNGRDYVRRYNWQDIATQMAQTYNWILGRAEKPDCVRLD
jgi:glycosyltransferase involved in cell wall biosynthesis